MCLVCGGRSSPRLKPTDPWLLGAWDTVVGWSCAGVRLRVCFRVCVRVFVSWLVSRVTVSCPGLRFMEYLHVKGHSDHEWNDMADALADDGRRGKIQATAGRAVD